MSIIDRTGQDSQPTSGVVFIFGQTGLELVQVSPQIVLLQFVTDRLHLGQLLQQRLVLLLYQLDRRLEVGKFIMKVVC